MNKLSGIFFGISIGITSESWRLVAKSKYVRNDDAPIAEIPNKPIPATICSLSCVIVIDKIDHNNPLAKESPKKTVHARKYLNLIFNLYR
jgi:hypothetical protein